MTSHEAKVIAEWRKVRRYDMAIRLMDFVREIDQLPADERKTMSALMFGVPGASQPVGVLSGGRP